MSSLATRLGIEVVNRRKKIETIQNKYLSGALKGVCDMSNIQMEYVLFFDGPETRIQSPKGRGIDVCCLGSKIMSADEAVWEGL